MARDVFDGLRDWFGLRRSSSTNAVFQAAADWWFGTAELPADQVESAVRAYTDSKEWPIYVGKAFEACR